MVSYRTQTHTHARARERTYPQQRYYTNERCRYAKGTFDSHGQTNDPTVSPRPFAAEARREPRKAVDRRVIFRTTLITAAVLPPPTHPSSCFIPRSRHLVPQTRACTLGARNLVGIRAQKDNDGNGTWALSIL